MAVAASIPSQLADDHIANPRGAAPVLRAAVQPSRGATRISNRVNTSFVQWLACAGGSRPELHAFTVGKRTEWRDPPIQSRCCFPAHGRCFRGVFDNRIEMGSAASYGKQIARVLADEFGVVEISHAQHRRKEYASRAASLQYSANWSELHCDYFEYHGYIFSSVLYLGDEVNDSVDLVGGETGIADELQRISSKRTDPSQHASSRVELVRGLVVEPRRGRLLLFSAGGENYHAPLAVVQGRRTTFQSWFRCACEESSAKDGTQSPSSSSESYDVAE